MPNYKVNKQELTLIAAYNRSLNRPTYVIHTPPESTIGGFSAEFVEMLDNETVVLKRANGDTFKTPLSLVTVRVTF